MKFHESPEGQNLFKVQIPYILNSLQNISYELKGIRDAFEKSNELKELKLKNVSTKKTR